MQSSWANTSLRYSATSKIDKQTKGIWYFRNAAGMDPEPFNKLQNEMWGNLT